MYWGVNAAFSAEVELQNTMLCFNLIAKTQLRNNTCNFQTINQSEQSLLSKQDGSTVLSLVREYCTYYSIFSHSEGQEVSGMLTCIHACVRVSSPHHMHANVRMQACVRLNRAWPRRWAPCEINDASPPPWQIKKSQDAMPSLLDRREFFL